jgi:hypothetical protein
MIRLGLGLIVAVLLVSVIACERTELPGKKGGTTQPATSAAPTTRDRSAVDELKDKAGAAATQAVGVAREAREQYREDAERELARLDAYVDELKKKLEQSAEDARPAIEQQIKEWNEKAHAARDTLERLKNASGDAWQEFRKGLDGALSEFRRAVGGSEASTQPASRPAGVSAPATRP